MSWRFLGRGSDAAARKPPNRWPSFRPRAGDRHSYRAISSASVPAPAAPRRWQAVGWVIGIAGLGFVGDKYLNAEALARTFRVAWYGTAIVLDYKINFDPTDAKAIAAMHERVAKRMHYVCTRNAGLFIKLGQSLGVQASILPAPYQEAFANIFDQAPSVPFSEVEKVFKAEFGRGVDEVFANFEREPVASASIAQVHRAQLNGQAVAVKVQKPVIRKQIDLDLFSYKTLLWVNEKLFDLPLYFIADYVAEQMKKETNFSEEARNAERTAELLDREPALRDKVIVPKVFWEYTSPRVMTAAYTPGCRLTDSKGLDEMGLPVREVMDTFLGLYGAMVFKWGWLHCDPHPGNVLVRPLPGGGNRPQIILIDHGLYIPFSEQFRREYCELWQSLFSLDTETVERIAKGWGIGNSDMFASSTLLRPTTMRKHRIASDDVRDNSGSGNEKAVGLKATVKSVLENEQLIPRELIFLARTMRMCQANNQSLGSPSNRIGIFAQWSVEGLAAARVHLRGTGIRSWTMARIRAWLFSAALFAVDLGFLALKIRQWWYSAVLGKQEGFEDVLQRQIEKAAHDELGIDIDEKAFMG